jgi:hypothetical protein
MKVRSVLLAAWLAAGLWTGSAYGQEQEPPKAGTARFGNPTGVARTLQGYVYGVVKRIEKDALILDKTEFGDDQTFKLELKTKFVHDGKPSKIEDLKVGEMVFVKMKRDRKTHEMIAERVVSGVEPTVAP